MELIVPPALKPFSFFLYIQHLNYHLYALLQQVTKEWQYQISFQPNRSPNCEDSTPPLCPTIMHDQSCKLCWDFHSCQKLKIMDHQSSKKRSSKVEHLHFGTSISLVYFKDDLQSDKSFQNFNVLEIYTELIN